MALELDTPESVSIVINKYNINSFAIDLDRLEITIGYDRIDSEGNSQGEALLIVDGPDFTAAIGEANKVAGADVYGAIKAALYSQIVAKTGKTGSVV